MERVQSYILANKARFLDELLDMLRIPSISADAAYAADVKRCAEVVATRLREAGVDAVEVCETPGHPIVYGEKLISPDLPTVLVYGHYDVQPPDPLDKWTTPPFEPVIKNERIYARGACDDKGQFYMHVKAFEAMMNANEVPCNIKFMIEGEEESGSVNLGGFCRDNVARLACDTVLISDTEIIANDTPSICVGLRGMSYMQVEVTGPNRDLHSGVYGGAVGNPINVLCDMISSLHDKNRHITVKGFYDDVETVSKKDRKAMNEAPFNVEDYKTDLGVDALLGEKGYTPIEHTSIRPTLDVNGIWGGYTGEGAKTVLPSVAYAKISMRLVPGQRSAPIAELFQQHFEAIAPDCVKVKVEFLHGGEGAVIPTDSVEYRAAAKAMATTFGKQPIPTRGGGSIPIVALFREVLGADSVLMGFGLDTDGLHSPNESYGLFNFYRGIETIPYFFKYYAEMKSILL